MKEWWMNLGLREKQAVVLGGMLVGLFLLYEMVWAPITTHIEDLRASIQHNQSTLVWMEETNQHINILQKLSVKQNSNRSSTALLSILQKEINQSPFASNLKQLIQAENNSVKIVFEKVNFDNLIKWLITLGEKQGLTITQMTATPSGALGIVDVSMVMG